MKMSPNWNKHITHDRAFIIYNISYAMMNKDEIVQFYKKLPIYLSK